MMNDLKLARKMLDTGVYTCVVCCGNKTYTATDRGVKPLLNWLESGIDLRDFSAADRVVGRATAFLYVLLGVRTVYARIMSQPAADVLTNFGIACEYDSLVEGIINRSGTGPCPFEAAVMNITDPVLALSAIKRKQLQLRMEANP